jgi:chromosome partitioning protein
MTASIITFASKKGGSGKSTAAMALAGALGLRGHRVLVVDTDEQGSCLMYARAADDDARPFPATVVSLAGSGPKLHRELKQHLELYDYIVVDTPAGTAFEATQAALLVSDLCLVPCQPSPADLWAVTGIRQLIDAARVVNESLAAFVLPSRVAQTGLANDVLRALAEVGLPVLGAQLGNRTAYPEAMLAGKPVQWLGSSAKTAATEVEAMTSAVLKILETSNVQA